MKAGLQPVRDSHFLQCLRGSYFSGDVDYRAGDYEGEEWEMWPGAFDDLREPGTALVKWVDRPEMWNLFMRSVLMGVGLTYEQYRTWLVEVERLRQVLECPSDCWCR